MSKEPIFKFFSYSSIEYREEVHTLIAAAVGNADPYNFNQRSCNDVQKSLTFSGSGLYISMISRPAEKTVGDVCQ